MATTAVNGEAVDTLGGLPELGQPAPDFELVDSDLALRHLADYAGQIKLISVVPSLDTPVCAASTREFYRRVAQLADVALLVVSADLPFAQGRFCATEGMRDIATLSLMRTRAFGEDYGVLMGSGPLTGLCARAVFIVDAADRLVYRELVPEVTREPDYAAIMAALAQARGE